MNLYIIISSYIIYDYNSNSIIQITNKKNEGRGENNFVNSIQHFQERIDFKRRQRGGLDHPRYTFLHLLPYFTTTFFQPFSYIHKLAKLSPFPVALSLLFSPFSIFIIIIIIIL